MVDVLALGIAWAGRQNWDVVVTSDFFFFFAFFYPEQSHNSRFSLLTPKPDKLSQLLIPFRIKNMATLDKVSNKPQRLYRLLKNPREIIWIDLYTINPKKIELIKIYLESYRSKI